MNNKAVWDYRNPYLWRDKVEEEGFAPLMIEVAVSSEFFGKESCPGLPESDEELLDAVGAAYRAGAVICRILPKDPAHPSKNSVDPAHLSRINRAIRERCPGMIINSCLNGGLEVMRGYNTAAIAAEEKPDLASLRAGIPLLGLDLPARSAELGDEREARHIDANLITAYGAIRQTVQAVSSAGILPVLELYQPGQYMVVLDLIRHGLLPSPILLDLLFGFDCFNYAHPAKFMDMLRELPPDCIYFSGATGAYQLPMNLMSMISGGHVRVGLGDSFLLGRGKAAESSAEQVERIVRMAGEMDRPVATVQQAREMLGLKG